MDKIIPQGIKGCRSGEAPGLHAGPIPTGALAPAGETAVSRPVTVQVRVKVTSPQEFGPVLRSGPGGRAVTAGTEQANKPGSLRDVVLL